MKYYRAFRVRQQSVPAAYYGEICRIYPDGQGADEFNVQSPAGDEALVPMIEKLVVVCEKQGLRRTRSGSERGTYGYDVDRVYEESEYNDSEYLLLRRQREIQLEHERDSEGRPLLIASKAKPSIRLGRIWPNWIIVSDKIRRLLEPQAFKGLEFGGVALKGKSIHASKEPFWELKSSVVMPVMANRHQFIHPGMSAPEPFQGDFSKIIMLSDPPFRTGEVHYRRSDLAPLLPFDVARTFENFMEPHPALIVSQRFYQFCLNNKIPLNVQPVRIDPG
jgi:hypothetical protein